MSDPEVIWSEAGVRVVQARGGLVVEAERRDAMGAYAWNYVDNEATQISALVHCVVALHGRAKPIVPPSPTSTTAEPSTRAETLCIGCHDVFNITQKRCARCEDALRPEPAQPALGALEQLGAAFGYGGKEMSGRTWDSLLADVRELAEGDNASNEDEEQMRMKLADALGLTRDPDEAPSWDELLGRVSGKRGSLDVLDAGPVQHIEDQLAAFGERLDVLTQYFATHTHVSKVDPQAIEARLADVEARIGQSGPLDAIDARLDSFERVRDVTGEVLRDHGDRLRTLEAWQRAATEQLGDAEVDDAPDSGPFDALDDCESDSGDGR